MTDLIDQEVGEKSIEINNNNPAPNQSSEVKEKNSATSSQKTSIIPNEEKIKEDIAKNIAGKAKDQIYSSWLDRFICCFNWLKKYFQITSKDFVNRLFLAIIPFNSKFYGIIEKTPDFYGPFWIYTTFILLVSSCGSLTRTIQGQKDTNFYQEFIPIASVLIYFIGFCVPLFLSLMAKIFGAKINVAPVICTYGYSYTIFLPIIIICSFPSQALQWILLAYASFSSTSLIIFSILKEMASVSQGKKNFLIAIILIFQIVIFFVLKLYFFKHINNEDNDGISTSSDIASDINKK